MTVLVPTRYEKDITKYGDTIRQMAQGRLNCAGTVTLAAGVTTTTVKAPTVAKGTIIVLSPQTSNAASAVPTTFISPLNITSGQFIISHSSNAQTDRSFGFIAIG
jgi:hypothetical protein